MVPRILLIEDDQYTRDFYHDLLSGEGYKVETAVDGKQGLDLILKGGWDLILLDIVMPKMDGLAVLEELENKKPQIPNGPIVILTVLGREETIKKGLKSGASGYFIKTAYNPEEILRGIKHYLKKPRE